MYAKVSPIRHWTCPDSLYCRRYTPILSRAKPPVYAVPPFYSSFDQHHRYHPYLAGNLYAILFIFRPASSLPPLSQSYLSRRASSLRPSFYSSFKHLQSVAVISLIFLAETSLSPLSQSYHSRRASSLWPSFYLSFKQCLQSVAVISLIFLAETSLSPLSQSYRAVPPGYGAIILFIISSREQYHLIPAHSYHFFFFIFLATSSSLSNFISHTAPSVYGYHFIFTGRHFIHLSSGIVTCNLISCSAPSYEGISLFIVSSDT
jgi:hypothetical protein